MTFSRYIPLFLAMGGVCRAAQLGAVTITPGSTQAGVAVTVTITAAIIDPTVIAASVNLQQLDNQGRVLKVLGTLADNGNNGDAKAGDRIFTIQFPVLPQEPGATTYRVSAGVLGSLNRIFSIPLNFNVAGAVATGIAIVQPSNLTFTNISPITITGTIGDPGAAVQVNGIAAARNGKTFQVSVPLQEGTNPITAVAANSNGTASTASIQVTLDTTPPKVTIDSPVNGSTTTESNIGVSGIVSDLVVGTVNDQQAKVTVNGAAARVANRRYIVESVPLVVGSNTIQVVSVDRTGNSATTSAAVTRQAPGQQSIKVLSGNNQSGIVGKPLAAPCVVQLTNGTTPAPNVSVIFKVTQNDGVLLPGNGKQQLIAVNTDAQGQARATLTLGHRSGAGNNTIQVTATGFPGGAVFSASGTPEAPAKINVDSGNSQFGPVGQALALPFVTVVSDKSNNRLSGVPVTFTVKQGGGSIGGQNTVQTATDGDGRALAVLALGLAGGQDNNLVEASFAGNTGSPAKFSASAKVPGNPSKTSISGVVVDNSLNPIAGVTMRLFRANQGINNNQPVQIGTPVPTDAKGFFRIAPAPVGLFKLMADGNTAVQPGKTYPTLEYDIVTIAGQDNGVGMPIYLPLIDPAATLCVSAANGGELQPPNSPGFSLRISAGAATFPGGSKTGCVSVSQVNPDKVPMTPAFGQQPRFVVTIQPVGTIFNPPAAVTIPNLEGLAPNSKSELFSYDHDLSTFVSIGSATVSADGSVIASDPGLGVLKAGWFDGAPPPDATFGVGPVDVKVGAGPTCSTSASSAAAASASATGDTCPDPGLEPSVGPILMKRGETKPFHALATAAGTFAWKTSDPSILRIELQPDPKFIRVTGLKPGKAEVVVRLTGSTPDTSGKLPFSEEHIDVNVWTVESMEINPAGDKVILKPPPFLEPGATEINVPLEISLKLVSPGADADQTVTQLVRLSFEDPDDKAASAVIDPNGGAGTDNASAEAGGRRGAVMWKSETDNSVLVLTGDQTASVLAHCNLNGVCKAQARFRSSAIAGDNYIFKAEETDIDGASQVLIRSTAKSGTWSVRKFIELHGFDGTIIPPFISTVMKTGEIAPAFSGDAATDYTLASVTSVPPIPGGVLFKISPPIAAELPTASERTGFTSTNPAAKAAATVALQAKATAWYLRNADLKDKAEVDYARRFGGTGEGPTAFSITGIDEKEDGVAGTGKTNFYPAGLSISVPTGMQRSVLASFQPDGDWPCLQVDVQVSISAVFIQPLCPGMTADHLRNLLRQAVARISDNEGLETTTGLMGPDAPSGILDDKNALRMRGYKNVQ